jgi:hypothetical protein
VNGPRRAAALLVALLGLTACSTVPSSSPTVPITQAPEPEERDIGIEPLSPEPGASPEEIVRGFIDAAASTGRGHPVAREYLTEQAAQDWADDTGVTVIDQGYATVTRTDGVVRMTATVVGTVDERGIFTVGGEDLTRQFTIEDVDGEWRIADPADGLVILEPDFQRVYDELHAYFLDPTGERVVPDPRYLVGGEAQPTALVERLFDGPGPLLVAGVRNALDGLALRRPVTVEGSAATVDLTGLPTDPEPPLRDLSAQLVWTLEQSRIRSVEVLVEGEPVQISGVPRTQTTDDFASYDPDAVPVDAVGHFVTDGALRTAPDGEPVPGPAGEGAYGLTSAAVAADQESGELSFMVGVTRPSGDAVELLAGPYGGALARAATGDSFTPPSVAATRSEVWTVRDGTEPVRVPAGANAQTVDAPTLAGLGTVERLQLSPDGVRAALVVDTGPGTALYLGTVERGDEAAVVLRDFRTVNPALTGVLDAAWRDGATLVVLAEDSEETVVPYEVGVDGWGLTEVSTSGLPDEPTTVAAAPNREPLVSATDETTEGQTIWRLAGTEWVTLVRGQAPVRGTEPFYPL